LLILSFIWIYYEIVNIKHRPATLRYVSLFVASFFAFSLHKAGAILVPIMLIFAAFYWQRERSNIVNKTSYLLVLMLVMAGALTMARGSETLASVSGLRELNSILNLDAETIGMIFEYKSNINEGASYNTIIDLSTPVNIILSIPQVFLNYMLQPFPQNVRNVYDVVALLEVLFRVVMLAYLYNQRHYLSKESRILLLFYFAGCFLWSVGTTNWGTAQRHHLTTNWMLVLVYMQHVYGRNFSLVRK